MAHTTLTHQQDTAGPVRPQRPRRMPRRVRQLVLIGHIITAGTWIGIDVMVAVLVTVAWTSGDATTRSLALQAMGNFVVIPMLAAAFACLVTGIVLGLGTKWGLLRYWWVTAKLVLNLALCAAIVLLLRPSLDGLAVGAGTAQVDAQLFFPPAVSLTALSVATVLAVLKPRKRLMRTTHR